MVLVQPWNRFFLYIICPVLAVLGSPFASRFLWLLVSTLYRPTYPSVHALQCQTGKHNNNYNNNIFGVQ